MTTDASESRSGNRSNFAETLPSTGRYVERMGETYYRIEHYDEMPPFFMSLVSSSDHWLFIASTGGLTAGRVNAESALFPYETDDKIVAHSEETGAITLIRARHAGQLQHWEPFSYRTAGRYHCQRNLYKNVAGNKLLFEEINHDLQLTYRYGWRTSERFGFVKSSWLENNGDREWQIALVDGLQNLMPYGTTTALQSSLSNLLNAYKRNELEPSSGLGIFALSATLTDRVEPSESLKATVAWQLGLEPAAHLLSTAQLETFRRGGALTPEVDLRGKAAAYLIHANLLLAPHGKAHWHVVADVNQDSRDVVNLVRLLGQERRALEGELEADISEGTTALVHLVATADGQQLSEQKTVSAHHFANVLFNIMRGGVFVAGYEVEKRDFFAFVAVRNRAVLAAERAFLEALPDRIAIRDLYRRALESGEADLARLAFEYLPLIFSRRHGDPSRPWNHFAIHIKQEDGSPRLDYQGNWRDIFQNWEPLAHSFPAYVEGMIVKFLNATTADGYNPYRVTRAGIEWEIPEPDNPWANIGYWSDHQIIYLQKLLEIADQFDPAALPALWNRPIFASADVPYRLRPYAEMLTDWYNTIDFDWESQRESEAAVAAVGTDGRLRRDANGAVCHVTMVEKLLVLLLAKLTNLVPEGGIWMNTQRPEWNDANNALVGKGLSVVTAAYLRRFLAFWLAQLAHSNVHTFAVSTPVAELLHAVRAIFADHQHALAAGFTDERRRTIMDALGAVATAYRAAIYQHKGSTPQTELTLETLEEFLTVALAYIDQTLRVNRRPDNLYHAYNILRLEERGAALEQLSVMLEGQVAILSSGLLSADEALLLLQSLRQSDLYRADQQTYMLYPNRALPGFLQKNVVTPDQVADSKLVAALLATNDQRLLLRDEAGNYHFHGTFRNAGDVAQVLARLAQEPPLADLVARERQQILDLFEATFHHAAFTGRSGTFFAFEGLGSIYWHMVAKLLLAVQECYFAAEAAGVEAATTAGLAAAYYEIRQGLGFNKSPAEYGAFPTDPYSHSPLGSGARQPGMTGQVKEEILTRWGELGVSIRGGALRFAPTLLRPEEFLAAPTTFSYWDAQGNQRSVPVPAEALAFTLCQTPVIYSRGDRAWIEITDADGAVQTVAGNQLGPAISQQIFARDNQIRLLHLFVVG